MDDDDKKMKIIKMLGQITKEDYVDSMFIFIEILYKKSIEIRLKGSVLKCKWSKIG